jgi:hypothetical protein
MLLALAAIAAGLWLGQSTVAAIDPFYRSGAADGRSYTVRGWDGANAVPAPQQDEFAPARYAANPNLFAAVIVERLPEPAAPLEWPDEADPPAGDDATGAQDSGWGDYECVDCDGAPVEDQAASQDDYVIAGRDCGDGWSRSGECREWAEDDWSRRAEF